MYPIKAMLSMKATKCSIRWKEPLWKKPATPMYNIDHKVNSTISVKKLGFRSSDDADNTQDKPVTRSENVEQACSTHSVGNMLVLLKMCGQKCAAC